MLVRPVRGLAARRVFEPRDQALELPRNSAGVPHRVTHSVSVKCGSPAVIRDLALDQLPKRDAHRRWAEADAIRSPGLVAHLDAGHTVAHGSYTVALLPPFVKLPTNAVLCMQGIQRTGQCNCVLRAERKRCEAAGSHEHVRRPIAWARGQGLEFG